MVHRGTVVSVVGSSERTVVEVEAMTGVGESLRSRYIFPPPRPRDGKRCFPDGSGGHSRFDLAPVTDSDLEGTI